MFAVYDYGRHDRTKPPRHSFQADILHFDDRATAGTGDAGAGHGAATKFFIMLTLLRGGAFYQRWYVGLDAEDDARFICVWLHGEDDTLVVFFAEPACFERGMVARQFLQVIVRAQR